MSYWGFSGSTEELSLREGNLKNNCITSSSQYDLNQFVSVDIGRIFIFHGTMSQVMSLKMKNVGHRWGMEKCSGKYSHVKKALWVVISNLDTCSL